MGLDITISRVEKRYCPHCGKEIPSEVVTTENSGGRVWYEWLEKIGYYVPYDNRTEENDWYGKDMVLTDEQAIDLYGFVKLYMPYNCEAINEVIAPALLEGDYIVINADW